MLGALGLAAAVAVGSLQSSAQSQSPSWEPASTPPPTAWAQAGARPWRSCDVVARQALAVRLGVRARGSFDRVWRGRAEHCPGAPDVLVLAAQEEILMAVPQFWKPETDGDIDGTIENMHERATEALRLLDAALAETSRRGEPPPFEAHYFRAYAQSMLGDHDAVLESLKLADREGDAARWRIERMAAAAELGRGNLDAALRLARLALADAPPDAGERQISRYVWAYVLDRAGSPAEARALLRSLRRQPDIGKARGAVESMLPVHERIFLRAIDHQSVEENSNALRLWDAYLKRTEPDAADRILAKRHRDELR